MEKNKVGWLSEKQPQFILQQIFKEFIGGKLGLSQKIEIRRVLILEEKHKHWRKI